VQLLLKAGIVVDVAVNITLSFVAKNVRNLKAKGDTVVTEVSCDERSNEWKVKSYVGGRYVRGAQRRAKEC
jgi:hypothetical protein